MQIFGLLLLLGISSAQTSTGGVTGTVLDATGAVIPGTRLTLTNTDTNDVRVQTSNEVGFFTFTALPPGRYRLEVESTGFKRFLQGPIEVTVQQFVTLNPTLEIGTAAETIEVTGQGAISIFHIVKLPSIMMVAISTEART